MPKVLFVYWGRRGSLSWIALEIARHLHDRRDIVGSLSFSTENELASDLAALAPTTMAFPTFGRGFGAFTGLLRLRRQTAELIERLRRENYQTVIVLMSHVWTPWLGRRLRRERIRYVVVAHDASRHPGDRTGLVQNWLHRDLGSADLIVTLSRSVADRLATERGISPTRIRTVPHPALDYGGGRTIRRRVAGPLRVLFLGRIMAYKGLDLLMAAVRSLKQRGTEIELGVFGEGDIERQQLDLAALGAEIVNRWIGHGEISAILDRYDVLVLPYVEASQSGVAAAAQGAGMPIVATPVGGLSEQIRDEVDGLIAGQATAQSIADCLDRLATEPDLYQRLAGNAGQGAGSIDVAGFAETLRRLAVAGLDHGKP